jgi:hypothetical protein
MSTNATVVKAWKDSANAYLAAVVAEQGGAVEYTASTPLLDADGNQKSAAQLKTDIIAAVKAKRDAQVTAPVALPITGTITL